LHTLKFNGKMGLFQKSVLKSYLNQQNKDVVEKAYVRFKKIYDSANIEEIKKLKEEEYQTGFFNDIFINVLGYTLRPTKDFNFKVEQKNVTDSKKADGAILNAKKEIIGVVELKSTATKNLDLAKDQAFNYKHNHSTCKYVIVSNFDKVQFYINDSVNKEEFSLFNMTREDFYLFYLCLAKDNILSDLPLKIKESSISEEKQITAKFYKDYTAFRDELYLNIKKNNQQNQLLKEHTEKGIKLTLFKKTQKLLDRFLFIFFAEDTLLLKHNFNDNILKEWEQAKKLDIPISLYDRYKTHFNYLDKGRAGTTDVEEIFAYNGGLFKPDPILDEIIKIDDDVLYKHSKQLSTYNFDSQVDVNILGHIFENSLNEIENITAEIEGDSVDKQKTKRKKDGIFYTPKYITKYIVDNTIGKLCDEKKAELKLNDIDTSAKFKVKSKRDVTKTLSYETEKGIESHSIIKKTNLSAQAEKHLDNIEVYRNYLLGLTIVDPACGSGAFLNQALVFLINEHKYLDELQSTITGSSFVFPNIENVVLEKNIYGVDINEESVEIAKLSLWLRTAQPRRKLNDLSNNIKCGNSLIDIKTVAGDKAFKWENEFPHVFANGGFDVVIGNPPYGAKISKSESEFISKKFNNIVSGEIDTYIVFYLETVNILKQNGVLGFITPDTWLTISKAKGLRKYLKNNTLILDIHDWYKPFKDAKDTRCHSIVLRKMQELNYNFNVTVVDSNEIEIKKFSVPIKNLKTLDEWNIYTSPLENLIFNKMKSESKYLDELYNIKYGLRTGENSKYLTNDISESIDGIKIARGSNIDR
jgi:type I restriction-modification system DNA methylase subunit